MHYLQSVSILFGTRIAGKYWTTEGELISRGRNIPSGIKAIFLAEDIMKYYPITIANNADMTQAAQIMTRNRISGLPVVVRYSNDGGNLVGIITKTDIIKALTFTID